MDSSALRAEFPVLRALAYLNAGTDGPLPAKAAHAAAAELQRAAEQGRARAHFERRSELAGELRREYATALGCDAHDVKIQASTDTAASCQAIFMFAIYQATVPGGCLYGAGSE